MTDAEVIGHRLVTLPDMIETLRAEAHRQSSIQRALVDGAMILEADPGVMRTVLVLDTTADFIERFQPHFGPFKRYIAEQRFGGRR